MIARLLISPSPDKRIEEIEKVLSSFGITKNHPDLLYFPQDAKLGVEQARKIKLHFSLKPYRAKGRAVVLEDAANLTVEAQNALLKTLEEPPPEAILILGTASDVKLLPTILSRCEIVRLQVTAGPRRGGQQEINYTKEIEMLLSAKIDERFVYIEKLKEKGEFLQALVGYFHQNLSSHIKDREFLAELLTAEERSNQNVNIRAILEYLMLVMPGKL